MKKTSGLILLLFCICLSCSKKPQDPQSQLNPFAGEFIDLSHDFSDQTIYWVNAKKFNKEVVAEGMTENGYYYSANNISAAEHGGTHIDAPIHFAKDRLTVDKIKLENLIGPAIKIDLKSKSAESPDYLISVKDIESWESKNGKIEDDVILLFETGFGRFYPDAEKYLGTSKRGDDAVTDLHFPGLHPEAARWLVKNRRIKAIGLDTASIDYGQSTKFESHVALMSANIPAFENVGNLESLPEKGFYIIALPMKIKGGSGGPLRIIAFVPQSTEN